MSFINANTANPNATSGAIGTQQVTSFSASNLASGATYISSGSNALSQGVWLINACAYFQSGGPINYSRLNIIYNTSPITSSNALSSTYVTESAVIYFYGTTNGLQQVALNTMTVLYVGTTPYYYAALVNATTQNGAVWSIFYGPTTSGIPESSIIRATKIA